MSECRKAEVAEKPSCRPAHELWVEITTRITSSALHHLSGREEGAVKSVVSLFATARELMRKNPCATEFLSLASALLETVRPYTARWHALVDDEEKFLGAPQRAQFRAELAQLQERLEPFVEALDEMRKTGASSRPPATPAPTVPQLGADVPLGIDPRHVLPATSSAQPPAALTPREAVELMNALEAQHVCRRRELDYDSLRKPLNATGLALSGGGIRSATFCLGVVTVLAEAKLLRGFDYLSTVSGGGYLGSFLSNQFTAADARGKEAHADVTGREFAAREAARTAYGEVFVQGHESAPVRHLRNSSKYLLPATTSERLKLLGLLISGVMATTLLTAFVPVSLAYLVYWLDQWGSLARFGPAAAVLAILAGVWWLLRPITAIWRRSERIDKWAGWAVTFAALLATIAATPWVLALLQKAESWNWNWKLTSASLASIVTALSGAVVVKAIGAAWKYRRALSRLFILSGVLFFVVVYLITLQLLANEEPAFSVAQYAVAWTQCIAGVLLIWLVWALFVNLNLTGLHRYYRDRLASCYLQDPSDGRGIQHPPRLDQLADKLPYHLINTTVNLTSSRNPELRGRGGDFFLLSKYVCGSQVTGYQATERVSQMNPDLDLATAMAISGAAASTNMGTLTLRQYRTLMAIFNVRLGYWLRWRRDRRGWWASNAFVQLGREILGSLHERVSMLNLSDGGHIENLAVYELIRRKLKFIVCVDGGMDGAMDCADLNRLQRLIAIDFGYRLEFDAQALKLKKEFSSAYGALVKIDYTPEIEPTRDKQLGWMLYIKLAMLGTEASYVLDYRRENPRFPHQSTADQFFDEAQFEAYRKLGESAARSFLSESFGTASVRDFREWFQALAGYLLRDIDPVYR